MLLHANSGLQFDRVYCSEYFPSDFQLHFKRYCEYFFMVHGSGIESQMKNQLVLDNCGSEIRMKLND